MNIVNTYLLHEYNYIYKCLQIVTKKNKKLIHLNKITDR